MAPKKAAKPPKKREVSDICGEMGKEWSKWRLALVSARKNTNRRNARYYEDRQEGDKGVIWTNIRKFLKKDAGKKNGLYELKVKRRKENYVVYVGCTHRKDPRALQERIMEYCTGGSHKDKLINRAMGYKYDLWVRVKPVEPNIRRQEVEEMEDEFLAKYNYAWNKRGNKPLRARFPLKKRMPVR